MKVAAYVRVSSRSQKFDSQESEIKKWMKNNGIALARVAWYCGVESGKTLARSQFERLQKDIWNGKVKSAVVYRLDRISRRLRDGVSLLADWCERGLKVVVTQQTELGGAVGGRDRGSQEEGDLSRPAEELGQGEAEACPGTPRSGTYHVALGAPRLRQEAEDRAQRHAFHTRAHPPLTES